MHFEGETKVLASSLISSRYRYVIFKRSTEVPFGFDQTTCCWLENLLLQDAFPFYLLISQAVQIRTFEPLRKFIDYCRIVELLPVIPLGIRNIWQQFYSSTILCKVEYFHVLEPIRLHSPIRNVIAPSDVPLYTVDVYRYKTIESI